MGSRGWGGGRVAEITWEQSSARGLGVLLGVPVHKLFLRLMVLEPLWALHPWPSRTPSPPSLVSFSCPDSPTSGPPAQTFVFILLLTQLHYLLSVFLTHLYLFPLSILIRVFSFACKSQHAQLPCPWTLEEAPRDIRVGDKDLSVPAVLHTRYITSFLSVRSLIYEMMTVVPALANNHGW